MKIVASSTSFFVLDVEHAGGLGKDAMVYFRRCLKLVKNQLSEQQEEVISLSSRGFSNFSASNGGGKCEGPWLFLCDCG